LKVLHAFAGQPDGSTASKGRLIADDAGHLFGVTTVGGANDQGEVFELVHMPSGAWKIRTLYSFAGQPDAGFPYGGLTFDAAGNLYGTTYYDGANDLGSVYQLHRSGGTWSERVIYSFTGGADGSFSISNVVFDSNGNLYGTTSEGGSALCACGTIFKLTPGAQGRWTEGIIHTFSGSPDGSNPYNGLVADGAGNLFGTTVNGGVDDEGSVFEFTP
jgi:uncharacterized repeat protein (TIGR03803 family)